jgi:peroxisomal 2,4-dienoyl-CoA reductase
MLAQGGWLSLRVEVGDLPKHARRNITDDISTAKSGSGIGLGIARRLGLHGASVVIMGRRDNFLKDAQASLQRDGIKCEYYAGDVRSENDAKAAVSLAVDKFGKLDTLVNCAAGNFLSLAEDLSTNGFKTVIEIDLIGTFNVTRQAFEALRASKQGVVINISATLHYSSTWYQTHACAAKAGIDSLTRQLALEWGTFGIRVNGIAPGPIADTPGLTKLAGTTPGLMDMIPLGRMGTTSEIGDSAVFLCSNAASYISGHTIVVDGAAWLYSVPTAPRSKVAEMSRKVEKVSRNVGGAKL